MRGTIGHNSCYCNCSSPSLWQLSLVPCPLLLQDSIISKDINYSGSVNAFPIICIGLKSTANTEILVMPVPLSQVHSLINDVSYGPSCETLFLIGSAGLS